MTESFVLLDGGMGKHLLARGAPFRQPEWSALALMEGPEHVVGAHTDFIAAGADIITTNNYAVVPHHLGAERFETVVDDLVALSGVLARRAADAASRRVLVAGSLPPLFGSYEPARFDPAAARPLLARIAAALAPHVDFFLTETLSSLAEVRAAAEAAAVHDGAVWVSVTLADSHVDGRAELRSGETVTAVAELAAELGAGALLFNCSQPEMMESAVREARAAGDLPLGVYANAFVDKPSVYSSNDVILDHRKELDDGGYTEFALRWLDAGATIIGGCCGIMPHHIADLDALRH